MFNIDDDLKLVILDYHNYHQCVSLDHTLITTWNYFHALIPQLTLEGLKSIISCQDIIRKNSVIQVNYQLLVEYLIKLYTPEVNLDKVLELIHHFKSIFHHGLPDVDPEQILAFVDSLSVYYEQASCENVADQIDKLYGKFQEYTPNNIYYISELNLTIQEDMVSISLIGNLSGTEILDPFIVSSLCSTWFNYFPTGMFNPYQFYIYLLRMNLEFQLQQRKVLIICPNNCRLVNYEFSNIELFYIDEKLDNYYTEECLKFPDQYGLKGWIYHRLTSSIVDEKSIVIPSLLYQFSKVRDQLIHDPLMNQFNQMNIKQAGFVPGCSVNCETSTDKITLENEKFIVENEIVSEPPVLDYHYRIEHIYALFEKLCQYKALPEAFSTTSLDNIIEFFTQQFFPKLMSDKCGLYQPFALLFNEFLQSYKYSKQQINTMLSHFDHSSSTDRMKLFSPGIALDRELRGDTSINRSSLTSVFLDSQQELPPASPTKRKASISDSNGTIKKSKILERLQKDRLNFVSMFDDEAEEEVEDSFDTKIQRFKYIPNGGINRVTGNVEASQIHASQVIVESTPEAERATGNTSQQPDVSQQAPEQLTPETSLVPTHDDQALPSGDFSSEVVSSEDESYSDLLESSSEEEKDHSEYVDSEDDQPTKSPLKQTNVTTTIHPSRFYKTVEPKQFNVSAEVEIVGAMDVDKDIDNEEEGNYSSGSVVRKSVAMSSPVHSEEEEEEESEHEDVIEQDQIEKQNVQDEEMDEDIMEGEIVDKRSTKDDLDEEESSEESSDEKDSDEDVDKDDIEVDQKEIIIEEDKQIIQNQNQLHSNKEASDEESSSEESSDEDKDDKEVDEIMDQPQEPRCKQEVAHEDSSEESSEEESNQGSETLSQQQQTKANTLETQLVKELQEDYSNISENSSSEESSDDESSSSELEEENKQVTDKNNSEVIAIGSSSDEASSSNETSSEDSSKDESKTETGVVSAKKKVTLVVNETSTIKSFMPIQRMMSTLADIRLPITTIESKPSPLRPTSPSKSMFKSAKDSDSESESESETASESASESKSKTPSNQDKPHQKITPNPQNSLQTGSRDKNLKRITTSNISNSSEDSDSDSDSDSDGSIGF